MTVACHKIQHLKQMFVYFTYSCRAYAPVQLFYGFVVM